MTKQSTKEAKTETKPEDEVLVDTFTPEEEAALDAAAKGDAPVVVVEDKPDPAGDEVDPKAEIERLIKELAASNARTENERKRREDAEKKVVASVDDLEANEQTRITQADEKIKVDIELADAKVSDLRRQLREAKEAGELDKEDEINDKLLDAKIEHKRLIGSKEQFETWKGNRKNFWDDQRKKAEKAANTTPPDLDAFDASIYSKEALSWIDKNPQFKTDKKFRARATAAHHDAEAEGIEVDTPEYFAHIDKFLGKAKAAPAEETTTDEPVSDANKTTTTTKQATTTTKVQTLPPSRTGGTTQRQEGTRIKKLTAAEKEAADISGMTPEEYWDATYGPNGTKSQA